MAKRDERIVPLGELLGVLASRLKKVDLRIIDDIQALWPTIVDPVLAGRCQPEMIKDGVLIVRVPSGAFAQRVISDSPVILKGFSVLGSKAPVSIKTRISES
jgi:predicted nucleic acid-binding Zn ribbon protein